MLAIAAGYVFMSALAIGEGLFVFRVVAAGLLGQNHSELVTGTLGVRLKAMIEAGSMAGQ
jgi:hypothetical protein